MKFAWKALVAMGIVLVLIALGMDTSVESGSGRVQNIGLQSDRQMLLILGCALLICGVVLFGVYKIKQTPEEAADEAKRLEQLKQQAVEWSKAETPPKMEAYTPKAVKAQVELDGTLGDLFRRSKKINKSEKQ